MASGSSEDTSAFEPWVPIEPIYFVQARVHRPLSRESLLNRSNEGISTIESWVPIEPLCFVQARVYRPLSRESLLNYYITGTKKRKTLLGRAPPVQARVYQSRVVSPYWTVTLLVYLWYLFMLDFVMWYYLWLVIDFTCVILSCVIHCIYEWGYIYILLRVGIWLILAIKWY